MNKPCILLLAGLLLPAAVPADTITDSAISAASRFISSKPEIKAWAKPSARLVDAWERISGLEKLIWLHHDGSLPAKWRQELSRRVSKLLQMPIAMNLSEDEEQLSAIIRLYTTFANLYLMREVKYNDYVYVRDYAISYGQRFSESVRGKPYLKNTCKWSDENCKAPPEVWAQN